MKCPRRVYVNKTRVFDVTFDGETLIIIYHKKKYHVLSFNEFEKNVRDKCVSIDEDSGANPIYVKNRGKGYTHVCSLVKVNGEIYFKYKNADEGLIASYDDFMKPVYQAEIDAIKDYLEYSA